MNRERMENLRRVAETLPIEDLDMGDWCECFAGNALRDAWMIDQGMETHHLCISGMMSFLDLPENQVMYLFIGTSYQTAHPTREQLLEHVDKVIREEPMPWVVARSDMREYEAAVVFRRHLRNMLSRRVYIESVIELTPDMEVRELVDA